MGLRLGKCLPANTSTRGGQKTGLPPFFSAQVANWFQLTGEFDNVVVQNPFGSRIHCDNFFRNKPKAVYGVKADNSAGMCRRANKIWVFRWLVVRGKPGVLVLLAIAFTGAPPVEIHNTPLSCTACDNVSRIESLFYAFCASMTKPTAKKSKGIP